MAHHGSTPQSVLDAPTRTITRSAVPFGATRHERRHGVYVGDLKPSRATLYVASLQGRNVPVVRADTRRGRKVRRLAREQA